LTLLAATGIGIALLADLFAAAMLLGIFSLLSAGLFVVMDAVDVAFTEAAVGAGVSTMLLLGAMNLTSLRERQGVRHLQALPLLVVLLTGGALVFGTLDMPPFGDPDAPIHHHVAPYYLEASPHDLHIPNVVTSVLASYRGFDTFGEVTVVLTAALGVLLLLGGRDGRRGESPPEETAEDDES
jgi:multicomponent Na+:H+ antiporter subunit B